VASDPPPASAELTVASALLELLKVEGVDRVFGIPGGALIAMLSALKADDDIDYHLCRQETGAAYMADGYARVSGGLGVVLVTSGPGGTNALTGAVNADAAQSPMLVITGEVKEQFFGRGYLQEGSALGLDIVNVYRDAVGYSELITSPGNFQELFASAMRRAWDAPRRATHLSLPNDVAASTAAGFAVPSSSASYRTRGAAVDQAGVAEAVAAIAAAERPALLLGSGCRLPLQDAALLADVVAAVEHLALPVMTTPEAKGVFPENHALSLRNYGIAACRWPQHYLTDPARGQFDALVVIGSILGGLATNNWNPILVPAGPFIQVDDDPDVLGRAFPITRGVVGEMTAVLRSFVTAGQAASVEPAVAAQRRRLIDDVKSDNSPFVDPDKRSSTACPVAPQALARIVSETVAPGSHIVVDAGNCVGWALHDMVVDPPTRMHSSLTMGPMGFATAAVIGAKLAAPDETCVAFVGDGGFLMQASEVATAAQYGIGAIWVVLADHDLSMVSQGMEAVTGDKSYADYYKIGWNDLGGVAQGLGAVAFNAETVDEVKDAFRRAIDGAAAGVPQVVVVAVDPAEAPPYDYPPPPKPP
jgi:acetolactate synthase I/II/III large subunit